LRLASDDGITERVISIRPQRCPIHRSEVECERASRRALQRKLDAIREYVSICAAEELEATAILDIIEADFIQE
jgi:hypothetical protein